MIPLPNLFVLGAAKSGTTTLWSLLRDHPDVHMSDPKEPTFFCSHFQVVQNPVWYFGLFNSHKPWRGDASHMHLTNPEAPPLLRALFPQARLIVILRDPALRAHALYRHMRRHLHADGRPLEPIDSFEAALEAEDARVSDRAFWAERRHYFWNYMYARSGQYDVQLRRYLDLFAPSQLLVLTLGQLARDHRATCLKLAGFLQIDPAPLFAMAGRVENADPLPDPPSDAARRFLSARLDGVTSRTEALLGQTLDWSL